MKIILLVIYSLISINIAFAHGENKLGPHRGYIRMPGTFHTELVPVNGDSLKIYLMDVGNKKSLAQNSTVKLTYQNNDIKNEFSCTPTEDHFTCKSNKKIDHKKGKFIINTVRSGKQEQDAVYNLPLKLNGSNKSEHGMENHDTHRIKH